jgi:hypothetical protein
MKVFLTAGIVRGRGRERPGRNYETGEINIK